MNYNLVSVVIPAYNEEDNIIDCIKSIKNQTYKGPIEIIIADNNSTDKTALLAKQEGATVVVAMQPGVCSARQAGTELAKGDIVISSDADTTFPTDWIEKIMKVFEKKPDVVCVGGPFVLKNPPWWGKIYTSLIFDTINIIYNLTGKSSIFGSNTAFRKKAWERYDTTITQGGDEVLLLRQLRKKGKVVFLKDNKVLTSARRLNKGFFYFIIFYVFDYFYSLIFGKSLVLPRSVRIPKEQLKLE